jgi:probable HAF family extracellular repeat protein
MHPIRNLSVILAATTVVLAAAVPQAATAAPPTGTGELIQLRSLGGQSSFGADTNERGDLLGASVDAAGNHLAVVWWRGQRSPTALGIDGASPIAINEQGHVVGYAKDGFFLWRNGSVSYLRPRAGSSFTSPVINDRDQVAGTVTDRAGVARTFLWQDGRMTTLSTPKGMNSRAVAINNQGQVVGTVARPDDATEQAVLWQNGRMTRLGTLGGAASIPTAINDRGQVSGNSAVAGSAEEHPFLWQNGRMTDLLAGTKATAGAVGDLNQAGMMTGTAKFGNHDRRPVLWRDGELIDIGLPGHVGGASALNENGDVTGTTWPDPQGMAMPFRWSDGQTTLFPEPAPDIAITVLGIDRNGVVSVDMETSQFGNIVLRSA